ncbi:MAG: DUF1289 domain-containing protein [Pseudomonadota bacterium]
MTAIASPCILVCAIDPTSGHCYGCGRTRDEISNWTYLSPEAREALMETLPERVEKLEKRPRRVTRRQRLGQVSKERLTQFDTRS